LKVWTLTGLDLFENIGLGLGRVAKKIGGCLLFCCPKKAMIRLDFLVNPLFGCNPLDPRTCPEEYFSIAVAEHAESSSGESYMKSTVM